MFHKIISIFVIAAYLSLNCVTTGISAPGDLNLPAPGQRIGLTGSYNPAVMIGMTLHPDNPFKLDFILDTGTDHVQGENLRQEAQKMIDYFLASLTVPENEMWVNLSPYEKDRIASDGLSATEMGRDMLSQDYVLKELTASLMSPEDKAGSEFWKNISEKTDAKYHTADIPLNFLSKIWIVPDKAQVYVNQTSVFVTGCHLKVMLEEDYLALSINQNSTKHGLGSVSKSDLGAMSSETKTALHEVIIPLIEKEVNTGKNFANLRQIYHAMILATWYKKNLKRSILGQIYIDRNKTSGIELSEPGLREKIYDQYLKAFKQGVYSHIREELDPSTNEMIPKKYFCGGLAGINKVTEKNAIAPDLKGIEAATVAVDLGLNREMATGSSAVSKARNIVITSLAATVAIAAVPHFMGVDSIQTESTDIISTTPEEVRQAITVPKKIMAWETNLLGFEKEPDTYPVKDVAYFWKYNLFGYQVTLKETPVIIEKEENPDGTRGVYEEHNSFTTGPFRAKWVIRYTWQGPKDGPTTLNVKASFSSGYFDNPFWARSTLPIIYLSGDVAGNTTQAMKEHYEKQPKPQPSGDQSRNDFTKGGIDFNSGNLDLREQGRSFQWEIQPAVMRDLQELDIGNIQGILPVITRITPGLEYRPVLMNVQ